MQKQITIGSILREYGARYISKNKTTQQQRNIINLLAACRTAQLGDHYEKCDHCNYLAKAYNSCRNRHCPLCQQKEKLQWLNNRMKEILPTGYYHLVFTLPHELNLLCLQNKHIIYGLLFKAVSQTLIELTRDVKHLGADVGIISVLHTWGQNLMDHPHLHCIMPAGGLSFDKEHWIDIPNKNNYFIPGKILSEKFKGKFLFLLKNAHENEKIKFHGNLISIKGPVQFNRFLTSLYQKKWVVNVQKPKGNPDKILEYLSRYVFRIAITDRRIIEVKDEKVRFSWKDYRTGKYQYMKLDVDEFIRRLLLHVLPKGFFKVRYYGIFANRYKKQNIQIAKKVLAENNKTQKEENFDDGCKVWEKQNTIWEEIIKTIENLKKPNCPQCNKGRLMFAGIVQKQLLLKPG